MNQGTMGCDMGDPLDMLAEECAEVVKEVMKARRFGLGGPLEWLKFNPQYGTPRDNIVQEAGDVLAILHMLVVAGFVTDHELQLAKERKMDRLMELFGAEQVLVKMGVTRK